MVGCKQLEPAELLELTREFMAFEKSNGGAAQKVLLAVIRSNLEKIDVTREDIIPEWREQLCNVLSNENIAKKMAGLGDEQMASLIWASKKADYIRANSIDWNAA